MSCAVKIVVGLAALLVAIPVAVVNIYLYDRLFGLPGTSTIPGSWLELGLMFVIPAILLIQWLDERYYYNWRVAHSGRWLPRRS